MAEVLTERSDSYEEPPIGKMIAPWTLNEVRFLEAWQKGDTHHPYTCGGDDCRAVLIAYTDGWRCPVCEYTQNWAWKGRASG